LAGDLPRHHAAKPPPRCYPHRQQNVFVYDPALGVAVALKLSEALQLDDLDDGLPQAPHCREGHDDEVEVALRFLLPLVPSLQIFVPPTHVHTHYVGGVVEE
jgi:hypothetical protein